MKRRYIVFGCTNGLFGFSLFRGEEPKDLWLDAMITEEQAQELGFANVKELMKAIIKDKNSLAYVKAEMSSLETTVELGDDYDFNAVMQQVLNK